MQTNIDTGRKKCVFKPRKIALVFNHIYMYPLYWFAIFSIFWIFALPGSNGFIIKEWIADNPLLTSLIVLAMLITVCVVFTVYSHSVVTEVNDTTIATSKGRLFNWKTAIRLDHIRHATVFRNPIHRAFGVSNIFIYTSGSSSHDMQVDCLTANDLTCSRDINERNMKPGNYEY